MERDMYKAKFPLDELSRASKSGDQKKVLEAIGHLGEHAILRQDPDGIFVPALGLRFLVNEYKLSLSLYEPEEKMDMSSPELS